MIPVNDPDLGPRALEYVTECVQSGWVSSHGRFIDEFESRWAAICGRRFGIAVCNGTAALQLATEVIGLEAGDEVIMPSFTIISCALAVIERGAIPVLVDVDPHRWTLDVAELERHVTPRTRAIMPVHIYGHPVDMDPVLEVAERHGLAIIEDAAEAHGAQYLRGRGTQSARWHACGSFGEVSCFSFYANKLVTTGEGGMLVTNDERLRDRARAARNLYFQPERRFHHLELGRNFRLTNLQAALGLAQLERFDAIVERKRSIGQLYRHHLATVEGVQLPTEAPWARSVFWMVGLVVAADTGHDAHSLATALAARGVETRPFFLGMHEQPALQRRGLFAGAHLPVTERLARQGLYLPSGLALTDDQVGQVCSAVREVLT